MEQYKPVEVKLLPQEHKGWRKGDIIVGPSKIPQIASCDSLIDSMRRTSKWNSQYAYILDSTAKIKGDDWVLFLRTWGITLDTHIPSLKKVAKVDNRNYTFSTGRTASIGDCDKIIASNDPKLTADGIPTISELFIKEYVERQGKGDVVMEMEGYTFPVTVKKEWGRTAHPKGVGTDIVLKFVEEETSKNRTIFNNYWDKRLGKQPSQQIPQGFIDNIDNNYTISPIGQKQTEYTLIQLYEQWKSKNK